MHGKRTACKQAVEPGGPREMFGLDGGTRFVASPFGHDEAWPSKLGGLDSKHAAFRRA